MQRYYSLPQAYLHLQLQFVVYQRYVDDGGHPDVWTAEAFRRTSQSNQLVKGKVEDLSTLRHASALVCSTCPVLCCAMPQMLLCDEQWQAVPLIVLIQLASSRVRQMDISRRVAGALYRSRCISEHRNCALHFSHEISMSIGAAALVVCSMPCVFAP